MMKSLLTITVYFSMTFLFAFSTGAKTPMNLTKNQMLTLLIQTLCEIEIQNQAHNTPNATSEKSGPKTGINTSGPLAFIDEMIRLSTEKHSFQNKASEQAFYDRIQSKRKQFLKIYFDQLQKHNLNKKTVKKFFQNNDIEKLSLSAILKEPGIQCKITPDQANRLFWEFKN